MSTKRAERVSILLKEVASNIVHRTIQFPDAVLVTVTRVTTSPDLHYSHIMVTVYPANDEIKEKVIALLRKNTPEIQYQLNRKLRMRPVPKITFNFDDAEDRRERVEKILGKTREEESL